MHTFADNKSRTWALSLDVASLKRVRDMLGVDLRFAAFGGPLLLRLADDAELLVNVLYVLCKDQADTRGVSDEDFGRGLVGEAIAAATNALVMALADFMPPARRRVVLAACAAEARGQS
jgi:hypothetical protein